MINRFSFFFKCIRFILCRLINPTNRCSSRTEYVELMCHLWACLFSVIHWFEIAFGSQEEQLDAILCTAVETSSLGLITGCIKQWTAEGEKSHLISVGHSPQHTVSTMIRFSRSIQFCTPFVSQTKCTNPPVPGYLNLLSVLFFRATRFSPEPTLHPRVGLEQGHPHQGRARRHLYVQGLHSTMSLLHLHFPMYSFVLCVCVCFSGGCLLRCAAVWQLLKLHRPPGTHSVWFNDMTNRPTCRLYCLI